MYFNHNYLSSVKMNVTKTMTKHKIANKVSKTKNPKEQFKNCSLRLRKP